MGGNVKDILGRLPIGSDVGLERGGLGWKKNEKKVDFRKACFLKNIMHVETDI